MKSIYLMLLLIFTSMYATAQNNNISEGSIFDGEPYISVNPNNPNHIVIAWMGFENILDRIQINYRVSLNGGINWSETTTLPHVESGYTAADPSIAFGDDGTVYIVAIDFTGLDSNPVEGGLYLYTSTDGGTTFNSPSEILNLDVAPEKFLIDRPWIAIDRSGTSANGTIYVTSVTGQGATAPYHPYISISTDGGLTFHYQELDGTGWLAGSAIPIPMPTPHVSSSGTFHAIYPSYVPSQAVLPQYVLATSTNNGATFSYSRVFASSTTGSSSSLPKTGYLCRTNPVNSNHIAFVYLSNVNKDLDIAMRESYDGGSTWSAEQRINDDPIANNRMQDLLWADFDSDGDLVICWRDRRNGTNETYETASEIWAAYRPNGATAFEPNFQITDETVAYDDVLAEAGNDFMSIQLQNDILHTVWGDVRSNRLNIWYQRSQTDGTALGITTIASTAIPEVVLFPNPSETLVTLKGSAIVGYTIYDSSRKVLSAEKNMEPINSLEIDMSTFAAGVYFVEIKSLDSSFIKKVVKK
ncbi:T9SS type A sorting domain-containing protein [Rasiella rasia]|uniref:T9SS type A sorting domain-containing protein n=1 Tax=Rasiella rasia TaxID=2744027 RepID=A0A6G6GII9_9FLAO|nr:T9SS type A sorting domain-containing protein [Rasiella rasia]QIE58233.1 T9SS type A sorting domain-containing protein [Rasiella rasia]